jgi:hypothetical protein
MRRMTMMALDRAGRTIDQDGHLHVPMSILSAAAVNDYAAGEIPDWQGLGLDPNRTYRLLRDPAELERAAPTFAGKPLMTSHRPISAQDHAADLTVGSVANPAWRAPYLVGELVVWDAGAIALIESGEQKALSCAYRFRADMTPGAWNGIRYDGVMRDLAGNHVALCATGRVDGAVVGDEMPQQFRRVPMSGSTDTDDDAIDPDDDVVTKIMKFLTATGKLSDEQLTQVGEMLAPSVAMDSTMRRRSARARMAADAAGRASFEKKFPDAARVRVL